MNTERTDVWVHGWMDGWMGGRKDGYKGGYLVDAWLDEIGQVQIGQERLLPSSSLL